MLCKRCGLSIAPGSPQISEGMGDYHTRCWEQAYNLHTKPDYVSGDPKYWPKTYWDWFTYRSKQL